MTRLVPLLALAMIGAAPAPQTQTQTQTQHSSGLAGHDSNAPVDVEAHHVTLDSKNKRSTLTGNVKAVQGNMTLTADQMVVAYTDKPGGGQQMQRLDASGNVVVRSPTETARSNYAIYDLDRKLITMIGGVVLDRSDGDEVRSQRLVYDLTSGKANVDTAGEAGGRVTGHFTVPQKADTTATPAPATKPSP